jgi:two-component sensor histidine kinase
MEFASNDHIYNLVAADADDLFYFSKNKIMHLQPSKYEEPYSTAVILISGLKVLDKEWPDASSLSSVSLPYNKNFFTVEFSVLKTNPGIPAQYKYKLDNFDKDWVYTGNRGLVNYTNVPPGKYTLLLNATDETGRWKKDPLSIRIIISPPFWETWWFVILVSISILSILYLFYRYRIGELKKMYLLRSKISQDLHDEVASTLSGIRLYSEMAKEQLQRKNSEAIQRSLQVISSNANEMAQDMSDIIWTINPSNDSFKKLLQKLKSYSHEISSASNMRFEYNINEQFAEEKLNMQQRRNIYLICKEAVNNAVKYSAGKNLLMDIERSDHSITIKIKDDGKGFEKENNNDGNGLINMQARAKEINAKLEIRSQARQGTCVELTVKLN